MKYGFMPKLMWTAYKGSFKKQLTETLGEAEPDKVMKSAHEKYKGILSAVNEFEKGDRFLVNILSCAMLSSVLLSLKKEYSVEQVRVFYRRAMCENFFTKAFSKKKQVLYRKG